MGQRHAQVLKDCGVKLVGVSDVDAATCAAVGTSFDVPEHGRFTDANEMLESLRPELVVVATTAPSHAALVEKAASCGALKVLCEKPMGTSLAECEAMLAACEAHGTGLAINHQMRFMEQYQVPKDLAASAAFGGLSSVSVAAGNFGMSMNGIHYFEMFRYLTGEPPARVSAWFGEDDIPNPRGAQFKDATGCIRMETASGKRFFMDCSADQGHGMTATYTCRNGWIFVDELSGTLMQSVRDAEHRDAPTTRYGMPHSVETRQITPADAVQPTRAVLEALLEGKNYPTGHDGLAAMRVLIAAHRSHARGGANIDLQDSAAFDDMTLPIA